MKLESTEAGAYDGWLDVGMASWSAPAAVQLSAAQKKNVDSFATRHTALQAYDAKKYGECAAAFIKLTSNDDVYSTACWQALAGQKDAAFKSLQKLSKLGFNDAASLELDEDLRSLRPDPRWVLLITQIKANEPE